MRELSLQEQPHPEWIGWDDTKFECMTQTSDEKNITHEQHSTKYNPFWMSFVVLMIIIIGIMLYKLIFSK